MVKQMNTQTNDNKFRKTHEGVKEAVRKILEEDEECRNDDNRLLLMLWSKELGRSVIQVGDSKHVTKMKDVYNARSEIQNNECCLLPTKVAVLRARRIKYETVKRYYGSLHPVTQDMEVETFGVK